MRESGIEKYLVDCANRAGAEIRKVKWIGRRGAPDRYFMHRKVRCWIELKASGKGLEEHQAREILRMREMGEYVVVFNSLEQVNKFFEEHFGSLFI